MKSLDFLSSAFIKLQSKEARIVGILLVREALFLSLATLAVFLSLESLLPGTVSLRTSILFFIIGISFALLLEQKLSKTSPLLEIRRAHSKKNKFIFLGMLFLWSAFLIGNALFDFHVGIIAAFLFMTLPLLWVFSSLKESAH